jgi:acyl-CoA thioester hydrolase
LSDCYHPFESSRTTGAAVPGPVTPDLDVVEWQFRPGREVTTPPGVHEGTVYAGTAGAEPTTPGADSTDAERRLFSIDADGRECRVRVGRCHGRFPTRDRPGHVNNVVYGTYCEEARVAWLEERLGVDPMEFSAVLASIELEFHQSVRGRATLTVAVRVTNVGRSSFTLEYRIRDGDQLMAMGESTQVAPAARGAGRQPGRRHVRVGARHQRVLREPRGDVVVRPVGGLPSDEPPALDRPVEGTGVVRVREGRLLERDPPRGVRPDPLR